MDTGETARTGDPGYFPRWHPYFRLAVRLDVTPEQALRTMRALVLAHKSSREGRRVRWTEAPE